MRLSVYRIAARSKQRRFADYHTKYYTKSRLESLARPIPHAGGREVTEVERHHYSLVFGSQGEPLGIVDTLDESGLRALRLLLDAPVSGRVIADKLRKLGHDVLALDERRDLE